MVTTANLFSPELAAAAAGGGQNAMQNALLATLSGNAGGVPDLQSLLAGQGQGGGLDLAGLLAAQANGGGNDQASMLMRLLEQSRAAQAATPVAEEPSPAELELMRLERLQRQREQQEQAQEVQALLQSLYAEVEQLRARNDALAAALGACYLCYGEDLTCPACRGTGRPGSAVPDPVAFRQYVAPALQALRARQPPASARPK